MAGVVGVPNLPDDAPDEEAVVGDGSPLGHLRHPQVKVHPVAGVENINKRFYFGFLKNYSNSHKNLLGN